jgi:uncharacterized membrane protein
MEILLALYAFTGLLLAGLSIPMILKKIPPNGLYGFRVPATVNNPAIWYDVNTYAGWRLLIVGLGTAIGSIVLFYTVDTSVDGYALSCLGLFLALFAWCIISSFLYLRSCQRKM